MGPSSSTKSTPPVMPTPRFSAEYPNMVPISSRQALNSPHTFSTVNGNTLPTKITAQYNTINNNNNSIPNHNHNHTNHSHFAHKFQIVPHPEAKKSQNQMQESVSSFTFTKTERA
mmetsp:Transcript_29488/g.54039  ORF Transcript_29488/g.54039 Transcript_29488/m.54039 type:complete len:115 (-) Transcript_29488:465-809(-)